MNERFLRAMRREPQSIPPVWFMRQAGRYHRHYQALKQNYSFVELCKNPDLAAETAMGPIHDFDFDVAILFSDLLFPLEALGLGLEYSPGPKLGRHLDESNIATLKSADEALAGLYFQEAAVRKTRALLPENKSLIGFVGGAWTLFTYAVEGEHKGNLTKAKSSRALWRKFSEIIVPLLVKNIELQLRGGAEVVMILDTAGGELDPLSFADVVVPGLRTLCESFPGKLAYYSKGHQPAHLRDPIFHSSALGGIGVDHRWDMGDAHSVSPSGLVQGNFDQSLLFLPAAEFEETASRWLRSEFRRPPRERAGWVCGVGHGVLPGTPEANVARFVQLVRTIALEFS